MGLRLGFSKVTNEIGKTEEFSAAGSYGKNIPYIFGSRSRPGEPLWFAPIEERVTKTSKKKGSFLGIGGTKVTTITYDYYATFAVWFGAGPATKLVRLWLDDKLVFDGADIDITDPEVQEYPPLLFRGQRRPVVLQEFTKTQEGRIPYKFYLGTEEQEVDPTIEAIEGVNNAPAYRGLCYIVFDRMKLEPFGNKLPKVKAEIIFDVGGSDIQISEYDLQSTANDPSSNAQLQIDYKRGLIYYHDEGTNVCNLTVCDLEGNNIRNVDYASSLDEGPKVIDTEFNQHYSRRGTGGIRHNSFTGEAEYIDHTNTKPLIGRFGGTMLYASPGSPTRCLFSCGRGGGSVTFEIVTNGIDLSRVGTVAVGTTTNQAMSYVTPAGVIDPRFGYAYYITSAEVFRMVRADGADGTFKTDFGDLGPSDFGLDDFNVASFTSVDFYTAFMNYDEGNNRVIGFVRGRVDGVTTFKIFAWSEAGGVVWSTTVPFDLSTDGAESKTGWSRLVGGRFAWTNGSQICAVNLGDGTIAAQYDGVTNGYPGIGTEIASQVYDDATNRLYMWNKNAGGGAIDELQVFQLFLGDQNGSTLSKIIRSVASECGMTEGVDFDVSAVDDIAVPGYMISKTDEGKKHLEPLLEFFQINTVDRDHRIYFEPRQTSSLDTLTEDDMIAASGNKPVYVRERQEESSLPQVFEVNYVDKFRDYEAGMQRASRAKFPIATTASDNTEDFTIDIALGPTEAKQQVEKLMYASWIERNAYSFALPQRWLAHTPGDLVTFQQSSGYTSQVMFDKIGIGADFSMKAHTVEQSAGMYVSLATSRTGAWSAPPVFLSAPSEPFLLDIPYLLDADSEIDTANISQGYWAGSDYGIDSNTWPGASLFRSYDNTVYNQIDTRINRADWGVLSEALAEPIGGPGATDYDSVVTVFMNSGYLAASEKTISHDDMLTGLYNRAVICHADGTFELIYFAEVVEISDRVLELHTLLRGRRGTDTNMVGAQGDRIVFLSDGEYDDDNSNYSTFAQPIDATLADDQFYKVVTRGLLDNETLAEAFNFTCADLKPYAPTHVEGWQETTDDIQIIWVRRTRLGGEMEDLVDVPLSEESEAYEIDIYNAAGTTIMRTLTSSTEEVVYEAAHVLADQGTANPASIKVGIYQMSEAVGRGFGRIVTIEV